MRNSNQLDENNINDSNSNPRSAQGMGSRGNHPTSISFAPIYADLHGNIMKASSKAGKLLQMSLAQLLQANFFDLLTSSSLLSL